MCRQRMVLAVGLAAFGVGVLAGCCIGLSAVSFCMALGTVGGGLWLLHRR